MFSDGHLHKQVLNSASRYKASISTIKGLIIYKQVWNSASSSPSTQHLCTSQVIRTTNVHPKKRNTRDCFCWVSSISICNGSSGVLDPSESLSWLLDCWRVLVVPSISTPRSPPFASFLFVELSGGKFGQFPHPARSHRNPIFDRLGSKRISIWRGCIKLNTHNGTKWTH